MRTLAANGDADAQSGVGSLMYVATKSMDRRAFVNADGELLFVPQQGRLVITTELGVSTSSPARSPFCLAEWPSRSRCPMALPVGTSARTTVRSSAFPNWVPSARTDLQMRVTSWRPSPPLKTESASYELVKKFGGRFWRAPTKQSPFNVVAWHGNLTPVKYDTANFMTIGSISFDHPDPSIFTVLTSPSDTPGTANCDFVIFPPRWLVMEDTFRPPWYHRNLMSEFMGLVYGEYDAKPGGFKPGGASLHNCMVPHGPDEEAFEKASSRPEAAEAGQHAGLHVRKPLPLHPTDFALNKAPLDQATPTAGQVSRTISNLPDGWKRTMYDIDATHDPNARAGSLLPTRQAATFRSRTCHSVASGEPAPMVDGASASLSATRC